MARAAGCEWKKSCGARPTRALFAALFTIEAAWLESRLAEPFPGQTVVITHHAPSRRSIHPRFADSLLNACFVSDAERLRRKAREPVDTRPYA